MTFTDQELLTLSAEIDSQLRELESEPTKEGESRHIGSTKKYIPAKQRQQLEQATGENADSFWEKFVRAVKNYAKKDICEEGGVLYEQFEEWGTLSKKDMLLIFGSVLSGMGLPAAAFSTVVVSVSVIFLHIGIKAFCKEC